MKGGEHSLKMSGPLLIQFGCEDLEEKDNWVSLINDKIVFRTAPDTSGLLTN